ncbi:Cytadhesion, partial [Operophtera brumata]
MEIKAVPKETLSIIPKYDGEENLLNLFISKCEYVVNGSKAAGNAAQDLYLFHVVSSKLTGRAATLLSDHPNIKSYEQLKDLLTQHFGDPRSEECIAIELETLKLKQGETYIQFCHRIQNVRSSLFAKVNRLTDEGIKAAKMIVYNNTALNVFLYNLPEDMIRIVRLKGCSNLENALSIVTEEVNFKFQYDAKNKILKQTPSQPPISQNSQNALRPLPAAQGFKPAFNLVPNNNFKFGIPQNNFQFGNSQNQGGFRPNFYQQNRFTPHTQGFRFGAPQMQPQRNFGQAPAQRAPFQHGGYKFGIPQQQGFKFGIQNQPQQNQHKFGIPQQQ